MVAAKLATMQAHRPTDDNPANLRTSDASKLLNVSPRSIETARTVQRLAIPELARAVERVAIAAAVAEKLGERRGRPSEENVQNIVHFDDGVG